MMPKQKFQQQQQNPTEVNKCTDTPSVNPRFGICLFLTCFGHLIHKIIKYVQMGRDSVFCVF